MERTKRDFVFQYIDQLSPSKVPYKLLWLEVFGNKNDCDFPAGFDFHIEQQQMERNYKARPNIFFLLWHINKHKNIQEIEQKFQDRFERVFFRSLLQNDWIIDQVLLSSLVPKEGNGIKNGEW